MYNVTDVHDVAVVITSTMCCTKTCILVIWQLL